jgi:hypothetical protein
MKKAFITLLIFSLFGCASIQDKICKDALIVDKVVHIDSVYYQECKPLVNLSETATFEDVISNLQQNSIIYAECRNKQHDSILLLKKFTNYKEIEK